MARDGVVQDGMYVEATVTLTYRGTVTDYEKGAFVYLDGRRVDLTPDVNGETSVRIVAAEPGACPGCGYAHDLDEPHLMAAPADVARAAREAAE